eukprot:9491141-Pyramimonas_sp.AAC.1
MALDVGSMASGGDEDVVMKGLVNFYKSPAMQALLGTKKRAPPTVELTQEDQDEKEMWERLQATREIARVGRRWKDGGLRLGGE